MHYSFFLDWRPVPSVPLNVAVDAGSLSGDSFDRLNSHARELGLGEWFKDRVSMVFFAMRSDGIFIFMIGFRSALSEIDQINSSCAVSSFLKSEWGHSHIYDAESLLLASDGAVNVLQKYPVQVKQESIIGLPANLEAEVEALNSLAAVISDPLKLLKVMPSDWPSFRKDWGARRYSRRIFDNRNAITVLRQKYDNIFNRVLLWQKLAKRPYETEYLIIRRRVWSFLLTYIIIVCSISVYELNPGFSGGFSKNLGLLPYGVLAALSWVLLIKIVRGYLESGRSSLSRYLAKSFGDVGSSTRVRINRKMLKAFRALSMYSKDFAFIALFSGPFVFPISEVPAPTDILKVLGLGFSDFGFEDFSAIVSLSVALNSSEFGLAVFDRAVFLAPFFLLVVYHWEVNRLRLPVETVLRNFVGFLNYAFVLDSICSRLLDASGEFVSGTSGLERSIEIVKERYAREKEKRRAVQRVYVALFVGSCLLWAYMNRNLFTHVANI